MRFFRLGLVGLLGAAAGLTGYAAQVNNQPWPAPVQPVSEESPALSVDAAMKTFYMPPGYHLELVASEPMVQDPILIDFDPDGRMYVVEMPAFLPDLLAKNERDPVCRVVVLEDTDNDGKVDKRTVFLDHLVLPRALKVLDKGVLVGEPPNLWLARDTNGDLRADTKELVTNTYGKRELNIEHNANGLLWAMDNWIYTSEHDGYLRLKNGKFEMAKTVPRGQWGVTQDDFGHVFRNTNGSAASVDLVPVSYYLRNPNLQRTRGMYETLSIGDVNVVWPARPNRGVNRGYQDGTLRADGTLARYTAAGSPIVYRGDRLPAEFYGNIFVAESAGNLVGRVALGDDGTTMRARRAYAEHGELLASTDERFRPVFLSSAPDGTLYVVDMYRGVIQYRDLITTYLHKWIVDHNLEQPVGFGRIYRIVHDTTRRDAPPALSAATPAQLVATLEHPNGWRRDIAQQLLVQRADRVSVPLLRKLAESAALPRTRVQAMWTLDGFDAIDVATVTRGLDDTSRDVRVAAVRLSERWLSQPNHSIQAAVLKHLDDPDWAVRRQLAATLGAMPQGPRETAIATLLGTHGDDPVTVDAAISGVPGRELVVLERMLLDPRGDAPGREAAITMLAAAIMRSGDEAAIQRVFAMVAEDARAAWQRSAMLLGTEVVTLGAPMPGAPAARAGGAGPNAGAAPCPTCPGARGGPGGDRAFPLPAGDPDSDIFFGANPAPPAIVVKVSREPAIVALAARDRGDLGQRTAKVLAKVEWAGKVGGEVRPVAVALSPAEMGRFTAGRSVFELRCQACHQANGMGLPGLAPALVNGPHVIGPAAVTARILLNGMEGPAGLMPPLGTVMTDEEIAAVLTYVRREWGNTGSPVDASMISQTRALTASHTSPWTAAELDQVASTAPR